MSITIMLMIGGQPLVAELDDEALAAIADAVAAARDPESDSEFLTVKEAAGLLRSNRQRVYDLTSSGRLPKVMDGARPLIRRSDLIAYLEDGGPTERSSP